MRKLCLWHPSAITLAELKVSKHYGLKYWRNLEDIVTGRWQQPPQQQDGVGSAYGKDSWDFDRTAVGLGPCKDEEEQVTIERAMQPIIIPTVYARNPDNVRPTTPNNASCPRNFQSIWPVLQVRCLIDQATDINILGRTWQGWKPYL